MVLPTSGDRGGNRASPKYVDAGIPLLFQEMSKQGALKSRLVIKVAGGAQMFSIPGVRPVSISEKEILPN